MTKYDQYLQDASNYASEHPEQRVGQAFMNVLYTFDERRHMLLPIALDPYNHEERFQPFLAYLKDAWADEEAVAS